MPENFNSKAVADRVAARLDLTFLSAVATAEDATSRLDERLHKSPLRDGFLARGHFADACFALWDLVLHDTEMALRAPTHELTRAHATPARRSAPAGRVEACNGAFSD